MPKRNEPSNMGKMPHHDQRSDVETDTISWMRSSRVDRAADYARRGRCHAGLSDEQLADAWKAAQRAMADDSWSEETRGAEQDLSSEFDLRGKEPPLAEVSDAIETLIRKVGERAQWLKADPEAWERANEAMTEDIGKFKKKRDTSKN